jgi:hypothetical protein
LLRATAYMTPDDLRAAMDQNAFREIFAEGGNAEVADSCRALQLCIQQAHDEVTSNLAPLYDRLPDPLPAAVPSLARTAEIAYAKYFAYDRKPALANKVGSTYLKDLWERAEARMDRLKAAVQAFPAPAKPAEAPAPAPAVNVGGIVYDYGPRVTLDRGSTRNSGDF